MSGEAMPTGRERPGEHWNARIVCEEAEARATAEHAMISLEDQVREAFEAHPDMMGGLLAVYALGKEHAALSTSGEIKP